VYLEKRRLAWQPGSDTSSTFMTIDLAEGSTVNASPSIGPEAELDDRGCADVELMGELVFGETVTTNPSVELAKDEDAWWNIKSFGRVVELAIHEADGALFAGDKEIILRPGFSVEAKGTLLLNSDEYGLRLDGIANTVRLNSAEQLPQKFELIANIDTTVVQTSVAALVSAVVAWVVGSLSAGRRH